MSSKKNKQASRAPRSEPVKPAVSPAFVGIIALSGFVALAWQILWMRQLGLVFGNGAHAAAMTLAVFFGGLAAGSWFWGRRSSRLAHPLRSYARLEFGIGALGLLCLPLLVVYRAIYPALADTAGDGGLWLVRAGLAVAMVFPAAFLMGGTIPVMTRQLVRDPARFGSITARMLGINTMGAACGAFATAFLLLPMLGFRMSCGLSALISLALGGWALRLAGSVGGSLENPEESPAQLPQAPLDPSDRSESETPRAVIRLLAFVSGFCVLALEVLWTRMFAQVHENSVYSFAAVLIVVLLALGAGAWLASWLAARSRGPLPGLLVLTAAAGFAVLLVPFSFIKLTEGLQMLPEHGSFGAYVRQLFTTALLALGPGCLLLGTLFPFLMKGEERFADQPGRSIGVLTAINTIGAIAGSLLCGFVLLEWLGLWRSMQLVAALYLLVALLLPARGKPLAVMSKAAALCLLLLGFTALNPTRLPVTGFDPDQGEQEVVERWEASDCTVTVVKKANGEHAIRINSNYSLGSSEAYFTQIYQSRVPLLAFPATESVFYLGMGTGMTAGEALDRRSYPLVEKVVVTELSPSVKEAAHRYFGGGGPNSPDLCNGLFEDPRATVLVRDGRNQLMADATRYDMINADLFLPYRSGAGSLYSLEHFQTARSRLKSGGVFVQWLPLYQLSEREFGIIARTMLEAFDRVSMWRCHFQPGAETIALVGHQDDRPLSACDLDTSLEQARALMGLGAGDLPRVRLPVNQQTILFFYCGLLSGLREDFADYPLNTDDRPLIEYGTPRSLHRMEGDQRPHFVMEKFADLVDRVLAATPPQKDPLLADRLPHNRLLPLAGAAHHRAWIALAKGEAAGRMKYWQEFERLWLESANIREAGE